MHRSALTLALVLSTALPLAGCAAALPFVVKAASVIADIAGVVDLIEAQAVSATEAGLLPASVRDRITAVRAVVARISDAAQQSPEAYAAAVAEFERLYAELAEVVKPFGVRVQPLGKRLASASPGTVQVPSASELGARLREAGAE